MKYYKEKLILIFIFLILAVFIISGCSKPFIVPGAQNSITIWQENKNLVKVYFSSNNSAARASDGHVISGNISTDGLFELTGFNLNEKDSTNISNSKIDFEISLDVDNYYKGLDLKVTEYTYLEFDIKFDDYYRRDLTSLGANLNYPEDDIFRINSDYLLNIQKAPFYRKRPLSSLIDKFFSDRVFALVYFIIISMLVSGIIIFSIKIRKIK